MGSTWRSISRGIFYFSLVISFIVILVIAVINFAGKDTIWVGFLVLVAGSVGVMVIHSLWGMLLEFFDNSAMQAYYTKQMADMASKQNRDNTVPSFVHSGQPAANYNTAGAGFWYCKNCGTSNSTRDTFCKNCGTYK